MADSRYRAGVPNPVHMTLQGARGALLLLKALPQDMTLPWPMGRDAQISICRKPSLQDQPPESPPQRDLPVLVVNHSTGVRCLIGGERDRKEGERGAEKQEGWQRETHSRG